MYDTIQMDLLRRVNAAVVLIFSNKFVIRCQSLHIRMKSKTYFWHPCSVYVFKSPEKGVYCIDKKLLTTSSLEQQDVIEQPTGLDLDLLKMTDSRRRFCEQTMGLRHVIPQGMGLRREVSALDKKEAMFLSLGPKSHTVIGMRVSVKVSN